MELAVIDARSSWNGIDRRTGDGALSDAQDTPCQQSREQGNGGTYQIPWTVTERAQRDGYRLRLLGEFLCPKEKTNASERGELVGWDGILEDLSLPLTGHILAADFRKVGLKCPELAPVARRVGTGDEATDISWAQFGNIIEFEKKIVNRTAGRLNTCLQRDCLSAHQAATVSQLIGQPVNSRREAESKVCLNADHACLGHKRPLLRMFE